MSRFQVALGALVLAALGLPSFAGEGDSRVIVGFKGAPDAGLLARHGADVDVVDASLRVAIATLPAARIPALRAQASVAYVEEDAIVEASGKPGSSSGPPPTQTVAWGVQRVWGAGVAPAQGSGVKVAVIDTGIDLTHPDLAANVAGGATFVARTTTPNDDNGHGSHVAGIIGALDNSVGYVGVAPRASLHAVKVLDRRGSGFVSAVAQGIDWARLNGMNIANMSLGSSSPVSTLQTACDNAASAGVLLVAAAGNSGDGSTSTTELSYPAAYASVVAVGATDVNDRLASFSNTGSFVEVSGPGVAIPSTYKSGGYATLSGTSMASPHAAGLAALLWNSYAPGTIRSALDSHTRDLGELGRDAGFGHGVVYYP